MQKLTHAMFAAVLGAAASGCGARSAPKVETINPSGSSQQLSGSSGACKSQAACPKASVDVSSSGFATTGGLLGFVGKPVPWDFKGVDLSSSDRRVAVLLNAIPSGARVEPEISDDAVYTELRIVWTPSQKQQSNKDLEIHLRDLDRCLVNLGADKCNNGRKSLPEYDTVKKLKWQIEDEDELNNLANGGNDVTPVTPPQPLPQPNCDDTNATGTILQGAIGVLTGGAAGLPQLLPGLLSTLNKPEC